MIYALENKEKSLEYLLLEFLEAYQLRHSDEKTMRLVKAILSKREISILPDDLKKIEKEELSKELERLIIEKAYDEEYKIYHLDRFLPIFMPDKKSKPSYKLKKAAITGSIIAITTITGVSGALFRMKSEKSSEQQSVNTTQVTSMSTAAPRGEEPSTQESIEELQKRKEELLKAEKERLEKEKQKVLTTFSECKSIKKIKLRQKQLENLKLTKKDKIYKKCSLSAEKQHFIYE